MKRFVVPLIVLVAVVATGCRPGPSTTPVKITRSNVIVIGDSITFLASYHQRLTPAFVSSGVAEPKVDSWIGRQAAWEDWLPSLGRSGVTVLALGANDVVKAANDVPESQWPSYFGNLFSERIVRAQNAGAQCVVLQRPDGRSWSGHANGDPARLALLQRSASALADQMEKLDGRRGVALSAWTPAWVDGGGTVDGLHLTDEAEQQWSDWLAGDVAWLFGHGC